MHNTAAVVIVAAGNSRRMQTRVPARGTPLLPLPAGNTMDTGETRVVDKIWAPLAGRITLAYTIDVFEASPIIDMIILVLSTEKLTAAAALCKQEGWRKIVAIVPGGKRRQDSVCAGLDSLSKIAPSTEWVMIHDGARPLVTAAMLEAGLQAAQQHLAAIAAVPVKDTIKLVQDGLVRTTLDRSELWAVQTPQVFSFPLIYQAHHSSAAQADVTDDAALLERSGQPVAIFHGAYTNIKITTQEDLLLAEALLDPSLRSG